MTPKTPPRWSSDVLRYRFQKNRKPRDTVLRHYRLWRTERSLADRCHITVCIFHAERPTWNGESLPLILDHIDGNQNNDTPENLRFVCPNCNSQLHTTGGRNRGRITTRTTTGYVARGKGGGHDHSIIVPTGPLNFSGHPPTAKKPNK